MFESDKIVNNVKRDNTTTKVNSLAVLNAFIWKF